MIKAVIFDFDGVIHDTFDFNLKWLNHFVNDNFKPLTNQEFRDLHNGNSYNLRIKNPKLKLCLIQHMQLPPSFEFQFSQNFQ